MAAKKKAGKKAVKPKANAKAKPKAKTKPVSKAKAKPKAKARAPMKKTAPKAKSAGTIEIVKLPVVDVTPQVVQDVVPAKAPKAEQQPQLASEPVEKHDDFQKALAQEPEKRGFWARFFGKN